MGEMSNIKGMLMEEMKKPIIPELRKLRIGEQVTFPIEQYGSVSVAICRLRKELAREHWDVVKRENPEEYEITIIRIA